MKKLSKAQLQEKDTLATALDDKYNALELALTGFNESRTASWQLVEAAIGEYNEARQSIQDFKDNIASDIQSYIDERSERWQESDAASAYSEWLSEYENEYPEAEISEPDAVEMPDDLANAETVNELPDEVQV